MTGYTLEDEALTSPDTLFVKLTAEIGVAFEKYTLHTVSQELGISCNAFFNCNILQGASVTELF